MKDKDNQDLIAPEQYELREKPAYEFNINRRRFFQVMGSGLAIAFTTCHVMGGAPEEVLKSPEDQVGAWIHVGAEGKVTIYTGKAEVGQNIRTSASRSSKASTKKLRSHRRRNGRFRGPPFPR